MPRLLSRDDEAMVRFVCRVTICSEAQTEFTREAFDRNFEHYYARKAFSEERRSRLAEFMKKDEVCNAMETINRALHDFDLKLGCRYTNFRATPSMLWRNLVSGLLILGAFGWLTVERGFDARMLLGIVPAIILLWYTIRYDWL